VPWTRGRALVRDFTCCDTLAVSYVNSTSMSHGAAARLAFEKKIKKYEFLSERYIMMPVAVETFGSWARESLQFIQVIGRRIAFRNGDPRSISFLLQRVSLSIQRGNVSAVLGSLPA